MITLSFVPAPVESDGDGVKKEFWEGRAYAHPSGAGLLVSRSWTLVAEPDWEGKAYLPAEFEERMTFLKFSDREFEANLGNLPTEVVAYVALLWRAWLRNEPTLALARSFEVPQLPGLPPRIKRVAFPNKIQLVGYAEPTNADWVAALGGTHLRTLPPKQLGYGIAIYASSPDAAARLWGQEGGLYYYDALGGTAHRQDKDGWLAVTRCRPPRRFVSGFLGFISSSVLRLAETDCEQWWAIAAAISNSWHTRRREMLACLKWGTLFKSRKEWLEDERLVSLCEIGFDESEWRARRRLFVREFDGRVRELMA